MENRRRNRRFDRRVKSRRSASVARNRPAARAPCAPCANPLSRPTTRAGFLKTVGAAGAVVGAAALGLSGTAKAFPPQGPPVVQAYPASPWEPDAHQKNFDTIQGILNNPQYFNSGVHIQLMPYTEQNQEWVEWYFPYFASFQTQVPMVILDGSLGAPIVEGVLEFSSSNQNFQIYLWSLWCSMTSFIFPYLPANGGLTVESCEFLGSSPGHPILRVIGGGIHGKISIFNNPAIDAYGNDDAISITGVSSTTAKLSMYDNSFSSSNNGKAVNVSDCSMYDCAIGINLDNNAASGNQFHVQTNGTGTYVSNVSLSGAPKVRVHGGNAWLQSDTNCTAHKCDCSTGGNPVEYNNLTVNLSTYLNTGATVKGWDMAGNNNSVTNSVATNQGVVPDTSVALPGVKLVNINGNQNLVQNLNVNTWKVGFIVDANTSNSTLTGMVANGYTDIEAAAVRLTGNGNTFAQNDFSSLLLRGSYVQLVGDNNSKDQCIFGCPSTDPNWPVSVDYHCIGITGNNNTVSNDTYCLTWPSDGVIAAIWGGDSNYVDISNNEQLYSTQVTDYGTNSTIVANPPPTTGYYNPAGKLVPGATKCRNVPHGSQCDNSAVQ